MEFQQARKQVGLIELESERIKMLGRAQGGKTL